MLPRCGEQTRSLGWPLERWIAHGGRWRSSPRLRGASVEVCPIVRIRWFPSISQRRPGREPAAAGGGKAGPGQDVSPWAGKTSTMSTSWWATGRRASLHGMEWGPPGRHPQRALDLPRPSAPTAPCDPVPPPAASPPRPAAPGCRGAPPPPPCAWWLRWPARSGTPRRRSPGS